MIPRDKLSFKIFATDDIVGLLELNARCPPPIRFLLHDGNINVKRFIGARVRPDFDVGPFTLCLVH